MAFSDDWTDDDARAITVTSQITGSNVGEHPSLTGRWPRPVVMHSDDEIAAADTVIVGDAVVKSHGADEVRVVDKDTGGEKGSKLARYDLIPVDPLRQLAEHYGKGAQKYDVRNWERGYAWGLSYAALQRHANAFWSGEDIDPDSRSNHMIAVAWHALALVEFCRTHVEKDDRS